MIEAQKVGKRIKQNREQANLTQDALAQRLNVSRQSISKWEKGESLPDIDRLVQMSEIFNISLDMLVTGKDSNIRKVIVEKNSPQHMNGWEFLAKDWPFIIALLSIVLGFIYAFFGN